MAQHHTLTVYEEDGFLRRAFPCATTLETPAGAWPADAPVRLLETDGTERPCQIDVQQTWPDGSIRAATITFAPFVEAWQTRHYTLEIGGQPPGVQVRNPIAVDEHSDRVVVHQGIIAYTVKKTNFNLVDTIVFRDKSFVGAGSRGPVLVLKDGTQCCPESRVTITPQSRGPWAVRLRVEGTYPQGFAFVTHLSFVSGKSWYLAEHQVVSGDLSRIHSQCIDTRFDLPAGPLASAFGARVRHDGVPTTWLVVTDGTYTVDIAILDAWTSSDQYVRTEIDPDGTFRARFPVAQTPSRHYVHVLHGPPDDVINTPAPAMAAELRCTSQTHSK